MTEAYGRVLVEMEELTTKIDTLKMFIVGNKFVELNKRSRKLLIKQLKVMEKYAKILKARIEAWED